MDLLEYVKQQHLLNKNKIILPLALGEMYKNHLLDKWLKRNQESPKEEHQPQEEEVQDGKDVEKKGQELQPGEGKEEEEDFDDWQGVRRQGQKPSDSEEEEESHNDEDDDDDDDDGGVMMPIPGM